MKNKIIKYLCEALGLGVFMFSAGFFDSMIDHPDLPIRHLIQSNILRRFLIGLTMGGTALFILNSSFGKKSGAHINPSVTLVQYRLGNIGIVDAIFYVVFQCLGAASGILLIYLIIPHLISHPAVDYIVTKPYKSSNVIAFIAEYVISFILISVVLYSNTSKRFSRYTAYLVAIMITVFITFEAPLSGMSMNPARTFGSALVANDWTAFWLYCIAPPLGMITGELFVTKILQKDLKDVTLHND